MDYEPNHYRTLLHHPVDLEDGPLTPLQRAIADAVRGCHALADFASAPKSVATGVNVTEILYGTDEKTAMALLLYGIAQARTKLDDMEAAVRAFGPAPFMPQPVGVSALGTRADTRYDVLIKVLRRINRMGHRLVKAGDKPIVVAKDGSFHVGP